MRYLRFLAASVLVALCSAPTCVSDVRQHGPEGPWTGVATNTSDQTAIGVVWAEIFDATGASVAERSAAACPSVLLPGGRGAFALTASDPDAPLPAFTPPLRAEFGAPPLGASDVAVTYRPDGLLAEQAGSLDGGRVVSVRVTNNFSRDYRDVRVCGAAFDAAGTVDAVSYAAPQTGRTLPRGRSTTINLFFADPPGGTLRLYAEGVDDGPAPPCCVATAPSDWQRADAGPFSVMLPPSWTYQPEQGIDSLVGSFSGDGVSLSFDYGWYSNSLPYDDDPAYEVHQESIDGRAAKVVAARGPAGTTGVYIPLAVKPAAGENGMATRLRISGMDLTAAQQHTVMQILRSVRFSQP